MNIEILDTYGDDPVKFIEIIFMNGTDKQVAIETLSEIYTSKDLLTLLWDRQEKIYNGGKNDL